MRGRDLWIPQKMTRKVESGEGIERRRELVPYEVSDRHVESGEGIESYSLWAIITGAAAKGGIR